MTTAREIIARAVAVARGDTPEGKYWAQLSPKSRDNAELGVRRLFAAGFRIVGPGEVDKETVEKCAEVAWNATISMRNHPHDAFRNEPIIHREIIATAIRALAEEKRP